MTAFDIQGSRLGGALAFLRPVDFARLDLRSGAVDNFACPPVALIELIISVLRGTRDWLMSG
jgi:hypothetical protein